MSSANDIKILTGNSNPKLAKDVVEYLGIELANASVKPFSDGEVGLTISESVRGEDCFVLQPTCRPVNNSVMELLIMIDALKRASASRITAVLPYYGYSRQDRKTRSRDPITAKLVANMITTAGADRVLTLDLHAGQIQGFFDLPVDHLMGIPLLIDYILDKHLDNVIVVSPDVGGVARARLFAERILAPMAIIDKRREAANVSEVMNIIGDVSGKTAIIIDDIVDTAGTLTQCASALIDEGASEVLAFCTHAVLSGPAIQRIKDSKLTELIVTDTIPIEEGNMLDNIRVLSVANLLGEAITRIHEDRSLAQLFL